MSTPMLGSWSTKRWTLVVGGACALAGFVLKMTDFGGRGGSAPVAEPAARSARPSTPGPRLASRTEAPSPTLMPDRGVEPDRGAEPGTLPDTNTGRMPAREGVASAHRDGTGAHTGGGSLGHRRDGAPSRTGGRADGGLEVGAVGSAAADGGGPLAAGDTGHPAGQHGAATAAGQPAKPDQAGKPEAPSGPPDVAFASDATATYPTDEQVEIPNLDKITGNTGTLSFWLQPGWQDGNQDDASLMSIGDGRLQVIKNVNFLRFEFVDDAGGTGGLGAPITDWKEGEWHQVTATWNGNTYSLYLDGQLVSQTVHPGLVDLPPDTKLSIGSDFPLGRPVAPGTIGRVDVHNRPLAPSEIARQYQLASASTK